MAVNKVILVGNVGRDPEVRYLDNGICVAQFSIATSEVYTNKAGERVTQTEWHNIVLWNKLAQVAENYVKKGKQVYIEGRLRTRHYDDKEGVTRYRTEIYGDTMQLLGKKDDSPGHIPPVPASIENPSNVSEPAPVHSGAPVQPSTPAPAQQTSGASQATSVVPEDDDDLPF